VARNFGARNLGGLAGLITMVHQIFGGIGAYVGAAVFDLTGTYDAAFTIMLIVSAIALMLALLLRRGAPA
jgi:ABC-type branched-subunit amino acid transport system permease subunit